jgi:hypothetical protein
LHTKRTAPSTIAELFRRWFAILRSSFSRQFTRIISMCPVSSPICTEVGLSLLHELEAAQTPVAERAEGWILRSQLEDGTLPHPTEEIKRYPHGGWWLNNDRARVLSLAGLLRRLDMKGSCG